MTFFEMFDARFLVVAAGCLVAAGLLLKYGPKPARRGWWDQRVDRKAARSRHHKMRAELSKPFE